jgi:hypothetical protein
MTVSPASSYRWYVWLGDGYSLADTIRRHFADAVDVALSVIWEDDRPEHRPDRRSRWSTASALSLNDRFNALLNLHLSGGRSLAGLTSTPEIWVELSADAARFLNEDEVRRAWSGQFSALGRTAIEGPDWVVRHSIIAAAQNVRGRTLHHCMDIRDVFQRDVVYPLDGRLVRSDARLTWYHSLGFCTQGNERTKLLGYIGEHSAALAAEWRRAQPVR